MSRRACCRRRLETLHAVLITFVSIRAVEYIPFIATNPAPPFCSFLSRGNVFLSLPLVVLRHCLPLYHPLGPSASHSSSLLFPLFPPIFPLLCRLLTRVGFRTKDPQATVKAHIKLLHDYNEIRDVGQGLMGIIADNRGVRARDVYQEFNVDEGD